MAYYIVKQRATTPGRFEHMFRCDMRGTVGKPGPGWTNDMRYALAFATETEANATLATLGDNRAYVSQIITEKRS